MARFDAFTGGSNTGFSPNISSEFTMNWLPELNPVPVTNQGTGVTDKNVRCYLVRTPGLKLFSTLPLTPVRGLFPGEFRLFAVGGDHLYEVFHDGSFVDRSVPGFSGSTGVGQQGGSIGNDGRPVQGFFNGDQLYLVSAGRAYLDAGNGPFPLQFSSPLTDLLVDPADTSGRTLTTPTGGLFDATDVGHTVEITEGAGFNVGLFQPIQSVNSTGGGIGASPWGVPGSGLGVGFEWNGQISYFDLQLLAGGLLIYSASSPFGASAIGQTLNITGGSGFIPGTYTITGIATSPTGVPTGAAILDRDAGTGGATGGTGTIPGDHMTASQGAFLHGYFFATPSPISKAVYYSEVDSGSIWDNLNFFVKHSYPDNVNALYADHDELYTFGNLESTQVWRDVGGADNPFSPDPGAFMHIGCQAPFSVSRLGNGVAWLGQDVRRGTRTAYHAVGYNPRPISTPAVEAEWARYTSIDDAVAFTYADQGHECWIINFPSNNTTWCYDLQTGWWHQRGFWTGTTWQRIRTWVHCVVSLTGNFGDEEHYGGDYSTGQIYIMSNQFKTDNGTPIVRRRRAPHLTVENQRRFYARFEIDCDVLGNQRIFWNRLGTGRDRVWQVDSSQSTETGGVTVTLRWSDDRTQSFQTVFSQTLDPSVDVALSNAYLNWVDATWH